MVALGGYAAQGAPPAKSVFELPAKQSVVGQPQLFGITVPPGDLDGDGDVDVAITSEGTKKPNRTPGKLVVMANNGEGDFAPSATLDLLREEDFSGFSDERCYSVGRGAVVADLNGDGRKDVLAADAGQGQVLPGMDNVLGRSSPTCKVRTEPSLGMSRSPLPGPWGSVWLTSTRMGTWTSSSITRTSTLLRFS